VVCTADTEGRNLSLTALQEVLAAEAMVMVGMPREVTDGSAASLFAHHTLICAIAVAGELHRMYVAAAVATHCLNSAPIADIGGLHVGLAGQ
jgi:hypothetical protein